MSDHVIVGDTEQLKGCLIYVCGTLDHANEVLHRMLTDPWDSEKHYHNIRIEEVPEEDCWWQRGCD